MKILLFWLLIFSTNCFAEGLNKQAEEKTLTIKCSLIGFSENYFQVFLINTISGKTEVSIHLAVVDEIKRKGFAKLENNRVNIAIPKETPYQACDINISLDTGEGTSACDEYSDSEEKLVVKLQCKEL